MSKHVELNHLSKDYKTAKKILNRHGMYSKTHWGRGNLELYKIKNDFYVSISQGN